MAKPLTEEARKEVDGLIVRARAAQLRINDLDQVSVDRAIQAVGWASANVKTFTRLAQMGVDESGLGDRAGRPNKRFKIMGILRDALRQKSMGIVEEIPEKGLVKYEALLIALEILPPKFIFLEKKSILSLISILDRGFSLTENSKNANMRRVIIH